MEPTQLTDQQPLCLEQVQAQFEQWRRNRGKRRTIPESLWAAAASLYPAYSLNRISRTLGLDYTRLKHRVQAQSPDPCLPAEAAFIELGFAGTAAAGACTVEMRHRRGSMTVQGAGSRDLMKLARLFWSRS